MFTIDPRDTSRMISELAHLRGEFAKLRPITARREGLPELPADTLTRAIRLSKDADMILMRAQNAGVEASVPSVVHRIREFMLANDMPTTLKPGDSRVEEVLTRGTVLKMMREHWQDPAGFHEAVSVELGVRESEYAPPRRYTLGDDVIDAAHRVADYLTTLPAAKVGALPAYDDIALIAGTLANTEGEDVE